MARAPYEATPPISADGTFEFSCAWTENDGSPFPWAEYGVEYVLRRDGGEVFRLSIGRGITVDPDLGSVTFANPAARLCAGTYQHFCRLVFLATGETIPVFDGGFTLTEGLFG